MKTLRQILMLLGLPILVLAQTTATSTTLSSAVAAAGGGVAPVVIYVASATGITAPSATTGATMLVIDREAMFTVAVSGTAITVVRGVEGTPATGHVSGAKVWVGNPSGDQGPFHAYDPSGSCTASLMPYLPWIAINTGNVWNCGNGQWELFSTFQSRVVIGAAIASANTVAPTNPVFHVTGTTVIKTITVPPSCPYTSCRITIIFDGAGTWDATGNIAIASAGTPAAGQTVDFTYDPGAVKWYASRTVMP